MLPPAARSPHKDSAQTHPKGSCALSFLHRWKDREAIAWPASWQSSGFLEWSGFHLASQSVSET